MLYNTHIDPDALQFSNLDLDVNDFAPSLPMPMLPPIPTHISDFPPYLATLFYIWPT